MGPSPHGEGGLKSTPAAPVAAPAAGPSPHGEGGLKCLAIMMMAGIVLTSLPTRGGWIEIRYRAVPSAAPLVPPHIRGDEPIIFSKIRRLRVDQPAAMYKTIDDKKLHILYAK